jgi:hypothetical protein
MISDDLYSVWKRRRSKVGVDSGFADRVMDRIGGYELPQQHRAAVVAERSPCRFAWRVQVAAAVFVVGLGVGLIRASFMIVFLLLSTSRGY